MSAEPRSRIAIKSIHPFYSEGYAYAVLESFGWDFKKTGEVYVVTPDGKLRMLYVGAGDAHGTPFVKLVPKDENQLRALDDLMKRNPSNVTLERVSES